MYRFRPSVAWCQHPCQIWRRKRARNFDRFISLAAQATKLSFSECVKDCWSITPPPDIDHEWGKLHFLQFLCFLMGLFSPSRAFSGGFWQISLKRSLYVKNWKKPFLRQLFRATFPLNTDLNSSSGSPWDPLGPSGTPLGVPGGPRGGIEVGVQRGSCSE